MPKPFVLGIEVEEVALGLIMRKLNTLPGVIAIHMNYDKPGGSKKTESGPRGRKPREPRKKFERSGEESVVDYLTRHKTASHQEFRDHFSREGRSPDSINSVLFHAQKNGLVVRIAPNTYALPKKKTVKAKPKTKPKKQRKKPTPPVIAKQTNGAAKVEA